MIEQLAGALFAVLAVHGEVSTPQRLARNGGVAAADRDRLADRVYIPSMAAWVVLALALVWGAGVLARRVRERRRHPTGMTMDEWQRALDAMAPATDPPDRSDGPDSDGPATLG